jgi:hypothetical protein
MQEGGGEVGEKSGENRGGLGTMSSGGIFPREGTGLVLAPGREENPGLRATQAQPGTSLGKPRPYLEKPITKNGLVKWLKGVGPEFNTTKKKKERGRERGGEREGRKEGRKKGRKEGRKERKERMKEKN